MKKQLNKEFWTERYKQDETGWDLGEISPPIKNYVDQLKKKDLKILIPGAGNAYEAEYLIRKGFTDVTVCDLSPAPLLNLKKRLDNPVGLNLIEGDFFALNGKYDLILEQTFFCAIDPSLRAKYFLKMTDLLTRGGKLAGLLFDDALNDDRPPFGGNKNEYLRYVPAELEIMHFDRCYNSIAPRAGRELFMVLRRK